jgi:Protein of unknown function (DUF3515)
VDGRDPDGPPRAALLVAVVVALLATGTVMVLAAHRGQPAPVAIAAVPAPRAADPACRTLLAALPDQLGEYRRARTADPVPPGAAAWQSPGRTGVVILRCGLDRPADFVVGSPLQVVDDVSWFGVSDADRTTWFAVDRPVYVALTLPADSGPTPIQDLSQVIATAMPTTPLDPAPAR